MMPFGRPRLEIGRPRFEIVVGTANADERRLVSADTVRALTGLSESDVNDETLELFIDGVLAQCATSCKLARAGAAPLTLAQEAVRATWPAHLWTRGWFLDDRFTQLLLPWRAPITAIEITEGGVALAENVDYQLLGAGVVERLSSGISCGWPAGGIVVDYTAGWIPDDEANPVPADLVARIADQVKLTYDQRGLDLTLRSEDVVGVWSGAYNVAGGDTIATSGMLRSLDDALAPYRNPVIFF